MKNQTLNLSFKSLIIFLFLSTNIFAQSPSNSIDDDDETGTITLTRDISGGLTGDEYCAASGDTYSGGFTIKSLSKQTQYILDIQISTNANGTVTSYNGNSSFQPLTISMYGSVGFSYDLYYTIPDGFAENEFCVYVNVIVQGQGGNQTLSLQNCFDFCKENETPVAPSHKRVAPSNTRGNSIKNTKNLLPHYLAREKGQLAAEEEEDEEEEEEDGVIILTGEIAGGGVDPDCLAQDELHSRNFKIKNLSEHTITLTNFEYSDIPQELNYFFFDFNGNPTIQGVQIPAGDSYEFNLDFIIGANPIDDEDYLNFNFSIEYTYTSKQFYVLNLPVSIFVCFLDLFSDGGGNNDGTATSTPSGHGHKMAYPNDSKPNDLEIFPNPSSHGFNINYTISQKSIVNIDIYDQVGRKINSIVNSEQEAGIYSIEHTYPDNLRPSIYYIVYRIGNHTKTEKIIKI